MLHVFIFMSHFTQPVRRACLLCLLTNTTTKNTSAYFGRDIKLSRRLFIYLVSTRASLRPDLSFCHFAFAASFVLISNNPIPLLCFQWPQGGWSTLPSNDERISERRRLWGPSQCEKFATAVWRVLHRGDERPHSSCSVHQSPAQSRQSDGAILRSWTRQLNSMNVFQFSACVHWRFL